MRRLLAALLCGVLLAACAALPPAVKARAWPQRLAQLQLAHAWQLDGRAAVALGTQGWQASLNWSQRQDSSELRLAGPFGAGALILRQTAQGLQVNGAVPSAAVVKQLQERVGFDLPLDNLRYWLLGIPDPKSPFDASRNDQDRLRQLVQAGWSIDFDRYMPVDGDVLPARVVLTREGVRVRIAIDHWSRLQ